MTSFIRAKSERTCIEGHKVRRSRSRRRHARGQCGKSWAPCSSSRSHLQIVSHLRGEAMRCAPLEDLYCEISRAAPTAMCCLSFSFNALVAALAG